MIYTLRTLDGCKGSANQLLDVLNNKEIKELEKQNLYIPLGDEQKELVMSKNERKVFRRVYFKYLLMKVRAKISYMALAKR